MLSTQLHLADWLVSSGLVAAGLALVHVVARRVVREPS